MNTNSTALPEKEPIKNNTEDLLKHVSDYAETWYDKTVLTLTSKSVRAGAAMINGLLLLVLGLVVFLFLNISLGWWLGKLLNSMALGFLILGAFYLLILVVMVAARKTFINMFRNMLTKILYE